MQHLNLSHAVPGILDSPAILAKFEATWRVSSKSAIMSAKYISLAASLSETTIAGISLGFSIINQITLDSFIIQSSNFAGIPAWSESLERRAMSFMYSVL